MTEQNSELVERVRLDSIKLLKDYGIDVHSESDGLDPVTRFAEHIIAMVENDMAARLLSDGAMVAAFKSHSSGMPGDFELRSLRTKQIAALDHIGIAGEAADE